MFRADRCLCACAPSCVCVDAHRQCGDLLRWRCLFVCLFRVGGIVVVVVVVVAAVVVR